MIEDVSSIFKVGEGKKCSGGYKNAFRGPSTTYPSFPWDWEESYYNSMLGISLIPFTWTL